MSEKRIHPGEYSHVPESPETREFVYWQLLDLFGIYEDSEQRPGGMRRGMKHTDNMEHLSEVLVERAASHNEANKQKIILAKETVPKVLQELSLLKIAGGSYTYGRIAYFEARVFQPKDPSKSEEEQKAAGYKEEHLKEVFKYSPSGNR